MGVYRVSWAYIEYISVVCKLLYSSKARIVCLIQRPYIREMMHSALDL